MQDVLIVEDDLTIADMLQEALEADGFQVTGIACTIKAAVRLAEQHRPDFAVIDIRLANGDLGTDLGEHLHQTSTVKVMYSTGNSNELDDLEPSGHAVIMKPYRMADIGRGLKIIDQLAEYGHTELTYPRNFRLLALALPVAVEGT